MIETMAARVAAATPITVVTGFLGSGKTTLLNHVLAHPGMERTAVLVNELGEVGIDHLLVQRVDENTVLLNSGCLCCTVRGDLVQALRRLYTQRLREDVPDFRRVVLETTGLADPAPILHTFFSDLFVSSCFRLDGIVTTVDAAHGAGQLDRHPEAIKQAAVADRLLVTKSDLVGLETTEALLHRLRGMNPAASIDVVTCGRIEPERLFDAGLFTTDRRARVEEWLSSEQYAASDPEPPAGTHDHHRHVARHDSRIGAYCFIYDRPLSWTAANCGLELLVAQCGERLLRVKGILNIRGEARPMVIQGVQHVFHPPLMLATWPSADRSSRLVFITHDIGRSVIEAAMASALGRDAA